MRQAGRKDVNVIGLSLPNINKPYVHDGVVQTVVLWNTRDLGYLTVLAGVAADAEQAVGRRDIVRRRTARHDSGARQRRSSSARRCYVHQGQYRSVRFLDEIAEAIEVAEKGSPQRQQSKQRKNLFLSVFSAGSVVNRLCCLHCLR